MDFCRAGNRNSIDPRGLLNIPQVLTGTKPWLAESSLRDHSMLMNRSILAALLAALALTSCQQAPPGSDAEDERNPYFRQANKDVADLNYPAAIKQYEKALAVNPSVVKAYYQIGLLYGDKLGDQISAIYFYQKYLEARPNAAEREEVVAALEKAKTDFSMLQTNSPTQNAAEIAKMSRENVDYKQQIAQLQAALAAKEAQLSQIGGAATPPKATAVVPATPATQEKKSGTKPATPKAVPAKVEESVANIPSVPAATPPAAPAEAAAPSGETKQHTIGKGDTLWKLAKKYYPASLDLNEEIAKLKAANPGLDDRNLKIGTVINIP
ncbi:MAG: LysM peptidoglycan-binding domain-containing protein [Verrucomicrobia bacterium]|nr:LysM peptidoglycan-binding domain-containing protein [Verrucomicrobiota bacterium]